MVWVRRNREGPRTCSTAPAFCDANIMANIMDQHQHCSGQMFLQVPPETQSSCSVQTVSALIFNSAKRGNGENPKSSASTVPVME